MIGEETNVLTVKIFGKKDNHVPPAGRDLIRRTLHEKGVEFSFYEVSGAQRKSAFSVSWIFFLPPSQTPLKKAIVVLDTDPFFPLPTNRCIHSR